MTTGLESTAARTALLTRVCEGLARPIAWVILRPARAPALITPGLLGLPYRRVRLQSHGARLAAWHLPCEGARAGIVLCHGHNNGRGQLLSLLRPLHEAGFHVLLFDFRSHGLSGGSVCTYGYHERSDVHAAVRWLREHAGVERVGLFGISMGGAAALMTAAEDPEIAAVVTDCAFARLEEMVGQRFFFLPERLRETLGEAVRQWAERWSGTVVAEVDPEASVRAWSPRPLLVIHGERDMLTPADHGRRLAEAAGEDAELWIVPWAPHAGSRWVAGKAYARRVTAFFRRHLGIANALTDVL